MTLAPPVLDGIRVVELAQGLAGPVAALLLAEAGADVVKVEAPVGDPLRHANPAAFASWNRRKRSVVLDVERADGRAEFDRLLAAADVLVHDRPLAEAQRLDLDAPSLDARHPRLVHCGIPGYPPFHPDANRVGHELLVQARMGLTDVQVGWQEGPIMFRNPAASWAAAYLGALAVAARLYEREASGLGGAAGSSLMQGAVFTTNIFWNRATDPSPSLMTGPSRTPQFGLYQCADGEWVGILNPGEKVDLLALPFTREVLVGLPVDESLDAADRLALAMAQRPHTEWVDALRAADVAIERMGHFGEALLHPETIANHGIVDVDDPEWGAVRQAAAPFRVGLRRSDRVRSAPRLGEHGDEVARGWAEARPVPAPGNGPAASHPLDGVQVLDFGSFLAGPLATMLLADLGADVVKVEPLGGERVRGWRDDFFEAANRGKRSITVDLRSAEGQSILRRLIGTADVVHHNMRPRAATRLGIDADAVGRSNPMAIFSHVSAYGLEGARADWPGYDSVFQTMAGWTRLLAGEGNPPVSSSTGTFDEQTGVLSALGTVLALYHRRRTGEALPAYVSLMATVTFSCSETMVLPDGSLAPVVPLLPDQSGTGEHCRLYRNAEGWTAVVATTPEAKAALGALCQRVGSDDHEPFATCEPVALLKQLEVAGAGAEAVRQFYWFDFFDDPDHRRTGITVDYPHSVFGQMEQGGRYMSFGGRLSSRIDRAAPAAGEHTGEVLAELGLMA